MQRLIDTLSTSATVQMPDGSERPMNSAERKESIKEGTCARARVRASHSPGLVRCRGDMCRDRRYTPGRSGFKDIASLSFRVGMADSLAAARAPVREVKRHLDMCSEKVALGGRSAISACEVAVEDAQYMTKKMDDMVVRMFKRILALEEQVRNLGLVPVLPEGTDIETSMMVSARWCIVRQTARSNAFAFMMISYVG